MIERCGLIRSSSVSTVWQRTGKMFERSAKMPFPCHCPPDGAFSMDGDISKLNEICDLAEKYDAIVMVRWSHYRGSLVKKAGDTWIPRGVGRVDIITFTTFGKLLGGRFRRLYLFRQGDQFNWLRNQARPYCSLTPRPVVVGFNDKVIGTCWVFDRNCETN